MCYTYVYLHTAIHTHDGELSSLNEESLPFATCMTGGSSVTSDTERQVMCDLTHVEPKQLNSQNRTEVAGGGGGRTWEMLVGVQTHGCKVSKFWGRKVQRGDCS